MNDDESSTLQATLYKKFVKLFVAGSFVHITIILFIIDLYFTSPVNHGMTPHRSEGPPFAKRLVLFSADGLRAEGIYGPGNEDRAPYLKNLRMNGAAWGTLQTRVPTESRPGHIGMLAGFHEDPSAILTGWKANLVPFDSIINQSNYAWAYGSPDIVTIFPKQDTTKLTVKAYDPNDEDFSGKSSTIFLDTWVFDEMRELLRADEGSCHEKHMLLNQNRRLLALTDEEWGTAQELCTKYNHTCLIYCETMNCDVNDTTEFLRSIQKRVDELTDVVQKQCGGFTIEPSCTGLCEQGNIFFLHLLGMDSAGHVHKPDSKEYIDNIKVVDTGVKRMVELVEDYFGDKDTVFVFTSDHGMTNWGSHGDGTEHETVIPYIVWGAGVKVDAKPGYMQQADIAPLMATLIGIPIPINAVGVLNANLLDGTPDQVGHAMFANLMQVLEQYNVILSSFKAGYLSVNDNEFETIVAQRIYEIRRLLREANATVVVDQSLELIHDLKTRIAFMSNYYFYPKMFCAMLGFALWLFYLGIHTHTLSGTLDVAPRVNRTKLTKRLFYFIAIVIILLTSIAVLKAGHSWHSIFYPAFPLIILFFIINNELIISRVVVIFNTNKKFNLLLTVIMFILLNQLLVLLFKYNLVAVPVLCILGSWLFLTNVQKSVLAQKWLFVCICLACCCFIKTQTNFNYAYHIAGSILWYLCFFNIIYKKSNIYIEKYSVQHSRWKLLALLPLVLFTIASVNVLLVAVSFDREEGTPDVLKFTSWIISGLALFLITISPISIFGRLGQIATCLLVPLTLMSVHIDLVVYPLLIWLLYTWIEIEAKICNASMKVEYETFARSRRSNYITSQNYRRVYFYLALSFAYFFAVGNIPSFNGFDPLWTRTYLSVFDPNMMAGLIIVKIITPLFVITCAFNAVVKITDSNPVSMFAILMLFCGQIVLNTMLEVKNEGSWKDIGQSFSLFVIMNVIVVIVFVAYAFVGWLTTYSTRILRYVESDANNMMFNLRTSDMQKLFQTTKNK